MIDSELNSLKQDIQSYRDLLPIEDPYSEDHDAIMALLQRTVLILEKLTTTEGEG